MLSSNKMINEVIKVLCCPFSSWTGEKSILGTVYIGCPDGPCCVSLPGHSLWAAVWLLVRRPLWCVVARHHSHWAGRWRSPTGWDASSESSLQDPTVSPLEGAPTTQLKASRTGTVKHWFSIRRSRTMANRISFLFLWLQTSFLAN